ncbi:hypothetical protein EON65_48650 [archaeon]|nr:MAG: hypothetical protein EON65_48650 [archaeon]
MIVPSRWIRNWLIFAHYRLGDQPGPVDMLSLLKQVRRMMYSVWCVVCSLFYEFVLCVVYGNMRYNHFPKPYLPLSPGSHCSGGMAPEEKPAAPLYGSRGGATRTLQVSMPKCLWFCIEFIVFVDRDLGMCMDFRYFHTCVYIYMWINVSKYASIYLISSLHHPRRISLEAWVNLVDLYGVDGYALAVVCVCMPMHG